MVYVSAFWQNEAKNTNDFKGFALFAMMGPAPYVASSSKVGRDK